MHNDLYSPLYNYVLETWDEISESSLNEELLQSLEKFFPEIKTKQIVFDFNEDIHLLTVTITYLIIDLKVENSVEISLKTQQ